MAGRSTWSSHVAAHPMPLAGRDVPVVDRCGLVELTLERIGQSLRVVPVDVQAFAHEAYHRQTCVHDQAKKAAAVLWKGGVSFQFRVHDLRRTLHG